MTKHSHYLLLLGLAAWIVLGTISPQASASVGTSWVSIELVELDDLAIMKGRSGLLDGLSGHEIELYAAIGGTDTSVETPSHDAPPPAAIPEPMTLGLIGIGGLALLRRRR